MNRFLQTLLELGANVNLEDTNGKTALDVLIHKGREEKTYVARLPFKVYSRCVIIHGK